MPLLVGRTADTKHHPGVAERFCPPSPLAWPTWCYLPAWPQASSLRAISALKCLLGSCSVLFPFLDPLCFTWELEQLFSILT